MAKISTKNIVSAVYEMTRGKSGRDLDEVLVKVAGFLAEKRLLSKAPEILRKLAEMMDKEEGVAEIKVTGREIPSAQLIGRLEEFLKTRHRVKTIRLTVAKDEGLLGGVKIEGMGEVIDLTLRNKLNQMANHLITN